MQKEAAQAGETAGLGVLHITVFQVITFMDPVITIIYLVYFFLFLLLLKQLTQFDLNLF